MIGRIGQLFASLYRSMYVTKAFTMPSQNRDSKPLRDLCLLIHNPAFVTWTIFDLGCSWFGPRLRVSKQFHLVADPNIQARTLPVGFKVRFKLGPFEKSFICVLYYTVRVGLALRIHLSLPGQPWILAWI